MEDFRLSRLSMIEVGFLTLLLEIPCSILDIQAHSRGGAEGAEVEISIEYGDSCLPAIMRIALDFLPLRSLCSLNRLEKREFHPCLFVPLCLRVSIPLFGSSGHAQSKGTHPRTRVPSPGRESISNWPPRPLARSLIPESPHVMRERMFGSKPFP